VHRVVGAPGIYVRLDAPFSHAPLASSGPGGDPFAGLGKIAALGIKVSRHCSYHGLALNVAMDLEPFRRIDPCGYAGLATVDLRSLGVEVAWDEMATRPTTPPRSRRRRPRPRASRSRWCPAEVLKKPDWIRVKAGSPSTRFYEIKQILREHKLHTVCEEASARTSASASARARPPS
jgi:hypothetical protein